MSKDLSWKYVVIIVSFLETIALLTITGHETGAFIAVGLGVLGALGLIVGQGAAQREQTTAVKEQTNGNYSRMFDILEAQGRMLAAMQPVPPTTQAAPEEVHTITPGTA